MKFAKNQPKRTVLFYYKASIYLACLKKRCRTIKADKKVQKRDKIKIKKKLELTSNEAVKHAIISGLGFSIMPLIGIRNEIQNGLLKIIPIKGLPLKTTWQLIWLKEKRLTPIAESYLKYLELEKKNIISKFSL